MPLPKRHVHIVGISPRTGTTLLMELMVHCFAFDAYADHELSVLYAPDRPVDRYCSKVPGELAVAVRAMLRRPNLWVICMVRDPRDIVVSKHAMHPDAYWSNLGIVQKVSRHLPQANFSERFVTVRYEELVARPDEVQAGLSEAIPFLEKKSAFSQFARIASPNRKSVQALGGVRPISTARIGRWRQELPRLKAQLERYGDIDGLLARLGYENDDKWKKALEGVEPDNGRSYLESRSRSRIRRLKRSLRRAVLEWRDRAGHPATRPVITPEAHDA